MGRLLSPMTYIGLIYQKFLTKSYNLVICFKPDPKFYFFPNELWLSRCNRDQDTAAQPAAAKLAAVQQMELHPIMFAVLHWLWNRFSACLTSFVEMENLFWKVPPQFSQTFKNRSFCLVWVSRDIMCRNAKDMINMSHGSPSAAVGNKSEFLCRRPLRSSHFC